MLAAGVKVKKFNKNVFDLWILLKITTQCFKLLKGNSFKVLILYRNMADAALDLDKCFQVISNLVTKAGAVSSGIKFNVNLLKHLKENCYLSHIDNSPSQWNTTRIRLQAGWHWFGHGDGQGGGTVVNEWHKRRISRSQVCMKLFKKFLFTQ